MTTDRYSAPPREETLEALERHVRQGLGPEAGLVDLLKDGMVAEDFASSAFGRVIVRDAARRATRLLQDMVEDISKLTPDKAFQQQVALSLEIGILRRIAAIVAAGKTAGQQMIEHDQQLDAHSGLPPDE